MKTKFILSSILLGLCFLFFAGEKARAAVCLSFKSNCNDYTEYTCKLVQSGPMQGYYQLPCNANIFSDCNLCEPYGSQCGYCYHLDTTSCNVYVPAGGGYYQGCDNGTFPSSDTTCRNLGFPPGYAWVDYASCYAPSCTTGAVNCTGWSPGTGGYNTCGSVFQTRTCTHNGPGSCNPVTFGQSQTTPWNNCDVAAGYACVAGNTCEKTMGGRVTNAETGGGVSGVFINTTRGSDTTDANGNWSVGGFPYGTGFTMTPSASGFPCTSGYVCGGTSPTSPNPGSRSGTVGGGGDCGNSCNFTYTPGHVAGHVYIDYNHNGVKDAEDVGIANITVTATNPTRSDTTDGAGAYDISYLNDGSHTVTISVPAGYRGVVTSRTVTIGPNSYATDFFITPLYSITGIIYNDLDGGHCYNPTNHGCVDNTLGVSHGPGTDTPYNTGSTTVTITGTGVNQTLTQTDGIYDSTQTLESGIYTVSFTTLPTDYHMTYPLNGPPPSFSVTVGTPGKSIACSVGSYNDAGCSGAGSIATLNFGMNNEFVHTIHPCSDVRDEVTTQDFIPNPAVCGSISSLDVIQGGNNCSTGTGIYSSGTITPDFGHGQANANNWVVGGATPENFTAVNPGIIRTSNSYLLTTLKDNGTPTIDLSTVCTPTGCYLPDNLASGVYAWPYDTTILGTHNTGTGINTDGTYTFPTGKNYVFVIGNATNLSSMTFKSKILVPNSSTATFVTAKNIYVDAVVGESSITSTAPDMEGFYSADSNFVVQSNYTSNNRCNDDGSSKDLRFNLIGSIVVNAAGNGGTFINQRDLCAGDLSCPAVSTGGGDNGTTGGACNANDTDCNTLGVTYILNAPDIIKHKNTFWQELAP